MGKHIKDPNTEELFGLLTHWWWKVFTMFLQCLTESSSKQNFIFPLASVRLEKLKCPQVQNDAMYSNQSTGWA